MVLVNAARFTSGSSRSIQRIAAAMIAKISVFSRDPVATVRYLEHHRISDGHGSCWGTETAAFEFPTRQFPQRWLTCDATAVRSTGSTDAIEAAAGSRRMGPSL